MQTLWQDLRFALRQVWKNPGFSLTAIFSLALGIGATVSVFSVLYGAVIDPWPYAGFDRVCQINTINKAGDERQPDMTGPQVRQMRQAHSVEDMVAIDYPSQVLTGSDVPEDVKTVVMTGNSFQFF